MRKILPIILILTLILVACGGDKEINYKDLTVEEIIQELAAGRYEVEEITEKDNTYGAILKTELTSNKTARKELLLKTKDILKKLEDKDIEFINIEWQVELIDKAGNSKYNPVMRLDFKKETLDKMNWDNIDFNNLKEIADDYWEHQTLAK